MAKARAVLLESLRGGDLVTLGMTGGPTPMERSIANHDSRITTRRKRALLHEHCILLVDDHFVVRRALAEALTMLECHVVGVGGGEEALDTLRAGLSPCVIFLDPRMPRASGWLFRAAQLADPTLADIPVFVLSAMAVSPDMASALLVDEWLVKPPDPEAMVRLTASYCGHGAKGRRVPLGRLMRA